MKKIFILLILLSGVSLAQYTPAKKDIKFPAYYTHQVNGDSLAQMMYIINSLSGTMAITLTQAQIDSLQKAVQEGTWNINNVSGTVSLPTGASTSANQTTLLGYLHPATISLSVPSGTVSTEVDTTTITATTWFSFSVFAIDDTLQIALKGDFSDAITVYPFSVGNFINQDPVTFPKAYIRRNTGGAGTVTYQSKVSGY